ncbi:MAG: gas vesicle protein GvpG [Myxococcaceae bacterium]|nr:gas vesicle protein GvpG [Myxococcaceae bacterium]
MLIIDRMIVGGVRFVLDKIAKAAEQELNDDTALREELLAAQLKVEMGEMTPEEFAALEDEVLARIRKIRERTGQGTGPIELGGGAARGGDSWTLGAADIAEVDASFVADDFYGEEPAAMAPPTPETSPSRTRTKKSRPRRKPGSAARAKKRRR